MFDVQQVILGMSVYFNGRIIYDELLRSVNDGDVFRIEFGERVHEKHGSVWTNYFRGHYLLSQSEEMSQMRLVDRRGI